LVIQKAYTLLRVVNDGSQYVKELPYPKHHFPEPAMLSAYSAETLPILLALLPELKEWVTLKDDVFQVTFTTPSGEDFWLSSEDDDRLTVGLADYHCHFGHYEGSTPGQDAADAAAFVKSLQQGELVVVEQYRTENLVSSWVQDVTDAVPPDTVESAIPYQRLKEKFVVRKWNA
jgi:hypothetical protein